MPNESGDSMSTEDTLNEFELSPEEKAELDQLNALNEGSDELQDINNPDESVEVDEDTLKNLTNAENLTDPNNPDVTDGEEPGGKTDNEAAQKPEETPEAQTVEEEPLQAPDYEDQLQAQKDKIEQAEQAVQAVSNQLKQLSDDYDDGEVSQGKYDYERLELQRKLAKLDTALERENSAYTALEAEATQKVGEYQEAHLTAWRKDLLDFVQDPSNEVLKTNPNVAQQFDEILNNMGQSGMLAGLNNQQVLIAVRSQLAIRVPELNQTPYTAKSKAPVKEKPAKPKQNPNIPASLSHMQSQELPADDPFAHVRKLSGVKYEEAISKMSAEQRDQFFFG